MTVSFSFLSDNLYTKHELVFGTCSFAAPSPSLLSLLVDRGSGGRELARSLFAFTFAFLVHVMLETFLWIIFLLPTVVCNLVTFILRFLPLSSDFRLVVAAFAVLSFRASKFRFFVNLSKNLLTVCSSVCSLLVHSSVCKRGSFGTVAKHAS